MEKYNKVYFALWLLFSAATLSFMMVFVLSTLTEMFDEGIVTMSFFLMLFASEVIGFAIASLVIDRVSWLTACLFAYRMV
jgi:hypothetical protein